MKSSVLNSGKIVFLKLQQQLKLQCSIASPDSDRPRLPLK